MNRDEARDLLHLHADGGLEPARAAELEAVLRDDPLLRTELDEIVEENRLLEEALRPLKPSQSRRMHISSAMREVYDQARIVAETLPDYGWRVFRLAYVLVMLGVAVWLVCKKPPELYTMQSWVLGSAASGLFVLGMIFMLLGRLLARLEGVFWKRHTLPSALEILVVEVFGMLALPAALAMYWWLLPAV